MNAIAYVHSQLTGKKDVPDFKPGDNITVNYKIIKGNKERIQSFRGLLSSNAREQVLTATFTVRKIEVTESVLKGYFLSSHLISSQ